MDPLATFLKRFGDLVALLRADPGNDAAQDLALTASGAAIAVAAAEEPVRLDPGVESSAIPDDLSLQARLRARRVDTITITAEVDLSELLALARALAHDILPLPGGPHIEVAMIPTIDHRVPDAQDPVSPAGKVASNRRRSIERRTSRDRRRMAHPHWPGVERRRGADRRITGERRLYLVKDLRAESVRLYSGLVRASTSGAWEEALYTTRGLARLAPRVPQVDRRALVIQCRRVLRRAAIDAMLDLAERDATAHVAAVETLGWIGLDAAEAMLDRLRAAPVLGPRGFMLEALGSMPDVYPMVVPLLRSEHPHEIRYGAALAAKLGRTEATPLLRSHVHHPDEQVRIAAIRALGHLHHAPVGDILREALHHASPATRAAAAAAIGAWRGGALGVLLGAALETERDRGVWHALINVLGRIGNASACTILAAVAVARRSLFRPRGYSRDQRLAAVAALVLADTPTAQDALRRLARDADRAVQAEARRALEHHHRPAVAS